MTNRKQRRAADSRAKRSINKTGSPPQEISKKIASQSPASGEIGQLVTLFSQGRYAEGETIARQQIKRFPQQGIFWKALGLMIKLQGRNLESLEPMQKAVTLMPTDSEAHVNLGNILMDLGRLKEAVASYRRALEIKSDYAEAHNNLGNALWKMDHLGDAETSYSRALEIKPDYAEAHNNLGRTLKNLGRLKEAVASFHSALEIKPDYAEAYNNLGNALWEMGRLNEAEATYRRALEIKPDYAETYNNLGNALWEMGRLKEAEASYRRALEIKPDYAETYNNLGNALKASGRLKEAEASCRRALGIKPDYAEAYNNLGSTLKASGRLKEAEANCRRALGIKPDYAEAYNNLGNALWEMGRLKEAEASYRRALGIKPDFAEAYNNLGNTLKAFGRLKEAEASYRRALEINPDYTEGQSGLLHVLTYIASHHPSYYFEEACRFGEMVSRKVKKRFSDWQCTSNPERLRVGLVSGDLLDHPVAFFLESVLAQIDSSRLELIAYSTHYKEDELTVRIKPYFTTWKSLVGLNDEAAAHLIHADGVHLLLDLSGHTAHNRLPMFARKPAPVQTTWLGYLASTGVAEIDYLLGDPHVTPPEDDGHFSESVWRMPEVWSCLTPPAFEVAVGPLPALSTGCITFGCLNNPTKINDTVVTLWSKILNAIPSSRIFLKTKQLDDPNVCNAIRQRFSANGIVAGRLLLEGSSPRREEFLQAYNRIDIALDPFPYGGATTSYQGLWMAVPFITRKGDRFLSRCGQSIALNAGLSDWIAEDDDDYVAKAVAHSQDLKQLADLRAGLRQQVLASPLFDAPRFARNLEEALWGMWEETKRSDAL